MPKSLRYSFLSSLSAARDISSQSGERRVETIRNILSTLRGLVKCIVDRSNDRSLQYLYALRDTNSKLAIPLPQTNVKKNFFLEHYFGIAFLYIDLRPAKSLRVLTAGFKPFFQRLATRYLRKAD